MKKNYLTYLFLLLSSFCFSQDDDVLPCFNSNHPVDHMISFKVNKLTEIGIDTIIAYRYWKSTHDWKGYGKVDCILDNKVYPFYVDCHSYLSTMSEPLEGIHIDSLPRVSHILNVGVDSLTHSDIPPKTMIRYTGEHVLSLIIKKECKMCVTAKGMYIDMEETNPLAKLLRLYMRPNLSSENVTYYFSTDNTKVCCLPITQERQLVPTGLPAEYEYKKEFDKNYKSNY